MPARDFSEGEPGHHQKSYLNPRNTRDHFHPPPDAPTPGEDSDCPADYCQMLTLVLDKIEEQINEIWH